MKKVLLFLFLLISGLGYGNGTYNLVLTDSAAATNIQWYIAESLSGSFSAIAGATDKSYSATKPGIYYAEFTENGCENYSDYFVVIQEFSNFEYPYNLNNLDQVDNIQWYNEGQALAGETSSTLEVTDDGTYWAEMTKDHCSIKSDVIHFRSLRIPILADDEYETISYLAAHEVTGNVVNDNNFINSTENDFIAGDILSINILDDATQGSVTIDDMGNFTYSSPDGQYIGTDSFTYILCNEYTLCDTATVYINITKGEVIAIDDEYTADPTGDNTGTIDKFNNTVQGNVISDNNAVEDTNDSLPSGENYVVTLLPGGDATSGSVTIQEDGSFTYTAGALPFDGLDSFTYVVCVGNICDTATVYILVECRVPLTTGHLDVPNLLSPNNDGKNDEWIIQELYDLRDCYYSNEVLVFNRWEVKVFHKLNYGLDQVWWDGTSDGSVQKGADKLPAGTYYYIILINENMLIDDKWDNAITGYIHIQY